MSIGQQITAVQVDADGGGSQPPSSPPSQPEFAELAKLRAELAKLRDELALRDLALDGIQTTFVIADRTTPEPTVVYCNKKAADMLDMSRTEVIGKDITVFRRHNATSQPDFRRDYDTLASGQKIAYEYEDKRTDGSTYWRGVTVLPIFDSEGVLTRSVAMGADITAKREAALAQKALQDQLVVELKERERMAVELNLAQKLESVGRLASGIAHEINTPIQYIGDCIHFLMSGYADINQILEGWQGFLVSPPENAQIDSLRIRSDELAEKFELAFLRTEIPKAFERMSEGVARVSNIVNAMKEFAHPDVAEHNASDINRAIRSTLIVATNVYKLVARVHTEFEEIPDVVCNIGELNQVFLNLVVNSAHAIEDAGHDVSTGRIDISTAKIDDAVIIRVGDNGCGIPAENLSKLFDPFFTTKDVGRGTGQGLAIARSIVVDKHGGDLSVSSTVGVGTVFTLTLPVGGARGAQA